MAEDILLLVDGREELVKEITAAASEIRIYSSEQITTMLEDPNFEHFLQGNVRGPSGRADIVYERLIAISQLDSL